MGTNYYLHLGKRSSQGNGKPARFTRALPNVRITGIDHVTVVDEYGGDMSYWEFIELIADDQIDESGVGERFS